jgi:hypothetical protein
MEVLVQTRREHAENNYNHETPTLEDMTFERNFKTA